MMIGTSENSGGGISSVIRTIKKMPVWEKYSCYWLGTQIQRNFIWKISYALCAAIRAPFIMLKYDIVHFHIVPGSTLIIQLPELLFAKVYKRKIILEVHIGNQLIPYSKNRLFKWWLNQADLILLLAHKWEMLFQTHYKDIDTPVKVLYNASEIQSYIPFNTKQKLIIFAGTINENKAPDILLRAWSKLKDKYPDWKINIMGSGNIGKYRHLAEDLGLGKCVEFTGYIEGKEKKQKFHDASIFCLCSYEEGFPMVVLEAWSHNIAVITTPTGGLPDIIDDGKNCLIFPFGNYNALAERLDELISNPKIMEKIANGGYSCISTHFSPSIISEKLDYIYSECLKLKIS